MAQCIGRKGEGRNVLEGRNDLALLLDVDTVLCKLSVYCVELFCCNFSLSPGKMGKCRLECYFYLSLTGQNVDGFMTRQEMRN